MAELVIANKSDLVSIADKLREKTGSTDNLSFPDGFNEMLDLLGTSGWIKKMECFTVTLTQNQQSLNSSTTGIHHRLGSIPKGVLVVADPSTLVANTVIFYVCSEYSGYQACQLSTTASYTDSITYSTVSVYKKNAQKCGTHSTDWTVVGYDSTAFKAGVKYNIMVWI